MNPHDHNEDAEFEDFLKGEGDLARRLQELPQPQPPEALSAAILARATSDMHSAAPGPGASANDAVHDAAPPSPPARHYLRRMRVPLGLAASAVFALFAVRSLMPRAVAPVAERPAVVAATTTPVDEAPSAAESVPPPPAPKPVKAKRSVTRPAPAADIAVADNSAADLAAPVPPEMAAPPAPIAARTESKQLALAPPLGAQYPTVAAPVPLARMQAPMMAASASKPKAMTYFGAREAEALTAPAWLARIAEMLKAGETKEAHAEWLKFRTRYPDAEVPPELRRQLEAVN